MTIMKSETETLGTVTHMILTNARSVNITKQTEGIISTKQVVQWIRGLRSNSEDIILIYYSGHGSMDTVGTHILNFDPEVTNDFVARDGLREQLKQKPGRLKMLITDTCSNTVQMPPPMTRVYAKIQSRTRRYTKNLFLEHNGFLDITAASAGQYAWGNDKIGGYFTFSLIGSFTGEADANQDRFLSWKEVFSATYNETQKLFRKTKFQIFEKQKMDNIGQTTQKPKAYSLPMEQMAKKPEPTRKTEKTREQESRPSAAEQIISVMGVGPVNAVIILTGIFVGIIALIWIFNYYEDLIILRYRRNNMPKWIDITGMGLFLLLLLALVLTGILLWELCIHLFIKRIL